MITPSTNLAEIASTTPALTRELERLGLDYCCGGKRSLAEACREQQLDPEAVIAELAAVPVAPAAPADWIGLAPTELVNHLEATHHLYLKDALPRLSELATKISRVHGQAHPELIRVAEVLSELRADLEPHLLKEEEVLFPMIRTLASATSQPSFHCGSIANPIAVMEHEHVAVGALLEQLRALTSGYQAPAGTCASTRALMEGLAELEADTHLHVHKENNHLFPAVMALEERLTASSPLRV
jgi:regulator of cell morphogenesis and NO signaling